MKVEINRQLLGAEDLAIGTGIVTQTRSGQEVTITEINADNIPYDSQSSIKDKIDNFSATIQQVDKLSFNLLAGLTVTEGELSWNDADQTLDLGLDNEVVLQVGQELLVRGKNTSGSSISNGKVLMVTGAVGASGVIAIGLHDGTKASGHKICGVSTETFDINEIGFSLVRGKLRGINCTGTPYGETWNHGDAIWVSPNGNGAMTNIEPSINQLKMFIGIVVSNSVNGTLQVRVNGSDDNHFVDYVGTIEDFEGALL